MVEKKLIFNLEKTIKNCAIVGMEFWKIILGLVIIMMYFIIIIGAIAAIILLVTMFPEHSYFISLVSNVLFLCFSLIKMFFIAMIILGFIYIILSFIQINKKKQEKIKLKKIKENKEIEKLKELLRKERASKTKKKKSSTKRGFGKW